MAPLGGGDRSRTRWEQEGPLIRFGAPNVSEGLLRLSDRPAKTPNESEGSSKRKFDPQGLHGIRPRPRMRQEQKKGKRTRTRENQTGPREEQPRTKGKQQKTQSSAGRRTRLVSNAILMWRTSPDVPCRHPGDISSTDAAPVKASGNIGEPDVARSDNEPCRR